MTDVGRAGLLARRRAVVVGVDGRVGSAVVRRLAAEGCRVRFTSPDAARAVRLLARARGVSCEGAVEAVASVPSPAAALRAAVDCLGALDLLVLLPGVEGLTSDLMTSAGRVNPGVSVVRCDVLGAGLQLAPEEWAAVVVMIATGDRPSTEWVGEVRV